VLIVMLVTNVSALAQSYVRAQSNLMNFPRFVRFESSRLPLI